MYNLKEKSPMKIIILDKEEQHKVGGLVMFNHRLMGHMTHHGHDVYILRFAQKPIRQKNIYRLPYYIAEERSFIFLPTEKTLSIIRDYFRKIHPDIVYAAVGISPLDFLLPKVCFDMNIPLTAVLHADFTKEQNAYQMIAKSVFLFLVPFCKKVDMLHVFTKKMADFYIQKGVHPKKIITLPNGVDPVRYCPGESEFAKEKKISRGVLFLGRVTLQKNPEILIQSFLKCDNAKNTKLILVGHGEEEERLREQYTDPRIIFTGSVTNEQKKIDIIRSCQIFVLPSRFEGMPLALLEAMSVGLACVASDAGSNSETLGKSGIILPSTKIKQQLPVVLDILLQHPSLMQKLGKQARRRILTHFNEDVIFTKLTKEFERTITQYKNAKPTPYTTSLASLAGRNLKNLWRKAVDFNINI